MQILNTTNLNEARKKILEAKKKNQEEKIALLSQDDEFNRKALEIKGLDILIINENIEIKDYSKQRNSQLNEVLAKLASKNNISIGIQIEEIVKKENKEKARALSRLKQNIMLCKKAKAKLIFMGNIRDKRALQSLLIVLGADTNQASKAILAR